MTDHSTSKLIRMANQIGAFFAAYPEQEAVAGIADHINRFWTRTMRTDLLALVRSGAPGLQPLVAQSITGIRGD